MARGGSRPGAGAPLGGISQLRRVLSNAVVDGLEQAGRAKGLQGDPEQVARESAARIVSDMILSGQGADVLKLAALVAPKPATGDGGNDSESPVLTALKRMPGLSIVRAGSQDTDTACVETYESTPYETRPTDCESEGPENDPRVTSPVTPFFAPQTMLPLDLALEPSRGTGQSAQCAFAPKYEGEGVSAATAAAQPASARAAGAARPAPHPPAGAPTPPIYLRTENFENSQKSREVA